MTPINQAKHQSTHKTTGHPAPSGFLSGVLPRRFLALSFLSLLAACAVVPPPGRPEAGMLIGSNSRLTLYYFDKDQPYSGQSNCNGPCAEKWPPLAASAGDKNREEWSVIARQDGTHQWAYRGRPLYFWAKDKNPGDTLGDGINGLWHIARPALP